MEFKIQRADNMSQLRIKLPITHKELSTVRDLVDLTVRDKEGNATFVVHASGCVAASVNGLAIPLTKAETPINLLIPLDNSSDDLNLKYFVALVKKGLKAYLANYTKAQKEIEKLTEDIEMEE